MPGAIPVVRNSLIIEHVSSNICWEIVALMPNFISVLYIACCVPAILLHSEMMEGMKEEIIGMLRVLKDRIKQGKDFADLYTEDGVMLSPGEPPATGSDGISAIIKKYYDDFKMAELEFYEPKIELLADGKSAYSWHKFKLHNAEGKIVMSGNTVRVWKKDEVRKEWLVVLEMFNEEP